MCSVDKLNKRLVTTALMLLALSTPVCQAQVVTVQGVLQVAKLFIPAIPAQNGLQAVPSQIMSVYVLQLPLSLQKQLVAQNASSTILQELPDAAAGTVMVDVGWPDNDPHFNPFSFDKRIGRMLRITGSLSTEFQAPHTHWSPVFLKADKVEVLDSFDTRGW